MLNCSKINRSKSLGWKIYREEFISSNGNNNPTFYTFIENELLLAIRLAPVAIPVDIVLRQSGSELPWAYVTSKFRRCSRKIDSRQEAWREQTFFPVALATFAINRAYVGGIVVIFSITISPSLPHFSSAIFLGVPRYLTSRSLSVMVCTTAITLQAQRIATESCESRKIAIGRTAAGSARGNVPADLT